MALNRAIYVFTVVTIMYTPLGFMAVGPTPHMPTSMCSGKCKTKKTDILGYANPEYSLRWREFSPIGIRSRRDFHLHTGPDILYMCVDGLVLHIKTDWANFHRLPHEGGITCHNMDEIGTSSS